MKRVLLIVVLFLQTPFGFAGPKPVHFAKLANGQYEIQDIFLGNKWQKAEKYMSAVYLSASKRQIKLLFDCHSWLGNFQTSGGQRLKNIRFKPIETKCDSPKEEEIMEVFTHINRYKVLGKKIELYRNADKLIVLERKISATQKVTKQSIQGEFQLVSMHDSRRPTTGDYSKTKIQIDTEKERIACNVGCNSISGAFKTDGEKIEPLLLAMTEMFCEGISDNLERQFVDNLHRVNRYTLVANELRFFENEVLLIVLKRKVE